MAHFRQRGGATRQTIHAAIVMVLGLAGCTSMEIPGQARPIAPGRLVNKTAPPGPVGTEDAEPAVEADAASADLEASSGTHVALEAAPDADPDAGTIALPGPGASMDGGDASADPLPTVSGCCDCAGSDHCVRLLLVEADGGAVDHGPAWAACVPHAAISAIFYASSFPAPSAAYCADYADRLAMTSGSWPLHCASGSYTLSEFTGGSECTVISATR